MVNLIKELTKDSFDVEYEIAPNLVFNIKRDSARDLPLAVLKFAYQPGVYRSKHPSDNLEEMNILIFSPFSFSPAYSLLCAIRNNDGGLSIKHSEDFTVAMGIHNLAVNAGDPDEGVFPGLTLIIPQRPEINKRDERYAQLSDSILDEAQEALTKIIGAKAVDEQVTELNMWCDALRGPKQDYFGFGNHIIKTIHWQECLDEQLLTKYEKDFPARSKNSRLDSASKKSLTKKWRANNEKQLQLQVAEDLINLTYYRLAGSMEIVRLYGEGYGELLRDVQSTFEFYVRLCNSFDKIHGIRAQRDKIGNHLESVMNHNSIPIPDTVYETIKKSLHIQAIDNYLFDHT